MGKIEDSIKQLNQLKNIIPDIMDRSTKQFVDIPLKPYVKQNPDHLDSKLFAEYQQHMYDTMSDTENPFSDMVENIMKSNQESSEQIKILNETNNRQQQELEKLNSLVEDLQEKLHNMENSHKYDTLKTIAFSLISALLGAGATMFVPWAVNCIIKIIS